ncbi:MAG: hypothetical protein HC773_06825 [Scytonema sp. CRU_2_7]|nr:hypothetical protein [Scytonema sp. CRU_2_7]
MRGWVGVGKEVVKKMAGLLTASGFTGIFAHHPSAPLAQTGFQRFVCQSTKTFHAMIASSAILNLANLIQTSSLASAVEISLTPY